MRNTRQTRTLNAIEHPYTIYFNDGVRKIDAVLVYNAHVPSKYREMFLRNLVKQKLQIEQTPSVLPNKTGRMFVKIHAPDNLLWKYVKAVGFEVKFTQDITLPEEMASSNCTETILTDTQPSRNHPDARRAWKTISKERPNTFTNAERSMIVFFIMQYTNFGEKNEPFKVGLSYLLLTNRFIAAFPLHDGDWVWSDDPDKPLNDRQLLAKYWAKFSSWNKEQPLYHIEDYFGSEIAIFFAWLGLYNKMLIIASVGGVITVIAGFIHLWNNMDHVTITCATNLYICPSCKICEPKQLKNYCINYYIDYICDHVFATVYACFMAIWGTLFVELWKRQENILTIKWNINTNLQDNYRPEFQATVRNTRIRPFTQEVELYVPISTKVAHLSFSYTIVAIMILIALGAAFLVLHYEMSMKAIGLDPIYITLSSTLISLVLMISLKWVYGQLAYYLTNTENPRTQLHFDKSYMLKIILFAIVNNYGKVIYIAFIKGKLYTYPGDSFVRNEAFPIVADVCDPSGCIVDIFIFLAMNSILSPISQCFLLYMFPIIKIWYKKLRDKIIGYINIDLPSWEKNFYLCPTDHFDIMEELGQLVTQFGFITLLAAAFPLAPLCALFFNIITIKIDASKYVKFYRRLECLKSSSIAVWFDVIQILTYISVVTNALYMSFTSEMIFDIEITDIFKAFQAVASTPRFHLSAYLISDNYYTKVHNITQCFYYGQRVAPGRPDEYQPGEWPPILLKRIALIFGFVLVVYGATALLAYAIPDVPQKVKDYLAFTQRKAIKQSVASLGLGNLTNMSGRSVRSSRPTVQFTRRNTHVSSVNNKPT